MHTREGGEIGHLSAERMSTIYFLELPHNLYSHYCSVLFSLQLFALQTSGEMEVSYYTNLGTDWCLGPGYQHLLPNAQFSGPGHGADTFHFHE